MFKKNCSRDTRKKCWSLRSQLVWVAVKALKFSYCIGETILITMYNHYGNLS